MSGAYSSKIRSKEAAAGHETPEVDLPRTLLATASIAATVVVACIASRWIFFGLEKPSGERSLTPMFGDGLVLPPAPRLEGIEMMSGTPTNGSPLAPIQQLNSYGWTDRDKSLVRVPIERAMQMAVERNWLPSVSQPQDDSRATAAPKTPTTGPKPTTP